MKLDEAQAELKKLGLLLTACAGEYRIGWKRGIHTYVTDDLIDAIEQGRKMALNPPPMTMPPPGPMGRRKTKRGVMLKHNRKVENYCASGGDRG